MLLQFEQSLLFRAETFSRVNNDLFLDTTSNHLTQKSLKPPNVNPTFPVLQGPAKRMRHG